MAVLATVPSILKFFNIFSLKKYSFFTIFSPIFKNNKCYLTIKFFLLFLDYFVFSFNLLGFVGRKSCNFKMQER